MRGLKSIHLKEQILTLLRNSKFGLSTHAIQEKVTIGGKRVGINSIRRALKQLREKGKVDWFAEWYGCNEGYRRIYVMRKAKEKQESKIKEIKNGTNTDRR